MTRKNRIMIYGPKDDGTYLVEFRTAEGDVLAIWIPRTEAHGDAGTFKSGCPTGCSCRTLLWNSSKQRQERATPANTEFDLCGYC